MDENDDRAEEGKNNCLIFISIIWNDTWRCHWTNLERHSTHWTIHSVIHSINYIIETSWMCYLHFLSEFKLSIHFFFSRPLHFQLMNSRQIEWNECNSLVQFISFFVSIFCCSATFILSILQSTNRTISKNLSLCSETVSNLHNRLIHILSVPFVKVKFTRAWKLHSNGFQINYNCCLNLRKKLAEKLEKWIRKSSKKNVIWKPHELWPWPWTKENHRKHCSAEN